ncbi:MAG: TatD family hydrolase [Pirellulales bacterium]
MHVVDTHAHLNDPHLLADLPGVLERAAAVGVTRIMAIGTTAASSRECCELAERNAGVWAAVGIQPNYVAEAGPDDWDSIVALAAHGRVRAIGETGLDRYWDDAPFDLQQDYFDRHLRLAQQLHRAVVIHMRECESDVIAMLDQARQRGRLRGVMHSYTGTAAGALACVEMGLHISFAGMVTFKKESALREVAAAVPADRLLVETDSPYLSPEPWRGKRPNEPARVLHTLSCLAEARGVSLESLAAQTTANACLLFDLD